MKSKVFETACSIAISGWLWDESFNTDYSEYVSLSVAEMRYIANVLREKEGLTQEKPQPWDEEKAS